jgi:hypothetical protein
MKVLRSCFLVGLLSLSALSSHAAVIPLSSFDGSETVVDFNTAPMGTFDGDYTRSNVVFQSGSGSYMFQFGSGGLLGTSGAAFNTYSMLPHPNHDITMLFGDSISRFGMNFGTGSGVAFLSAVVNAYDSVGNLVDSATFTHFENAFVGFDFSTAVSKVVIDRTDENTEYAGYFTFLDNVRFVKSASVPESSSVALLIMGLLGVAAARLRRTA